MAKQEKKEQGNKRAINVIEELMALIPDLELEPMSDDEINDFELDNENNE